MMLEHDEVVKGKVRDTINILLHINYNEFFYDVIVPRLPSDLSP